jgi:hypothetical protein
MILAEHAARKGKTRNVYIILVEKLYGNNLLGRKCLNTTYSYGKLVRLQPRLDRAPWQATYVISFEDRKERSNKLFSLILKANRNMKANAETRFLVTDI